VVDNAKDNSQQTRLQNTIVLHFSENQFACKLILNISGHIMLNVRLWLFKW